MHSNVLLELLYWFLKFLSVREKAISLAIILWPPACHHPRCTTGQDQVKEQTKDQDPWRQFVNEHKKGLSK